MNFRAITPQGTAVESPIKAVNAHSVGGEFVLLPNHMPVVYEMVPGKVTLTLEDGTKKTYSASSGFIHYDNQKATLLTDAIEAKEDIDIARAEAALKRAEEKLANPSENIDINRARRAKARAVNRLLVAGQKPNRK